VENARAAAVDADFLGLIGPFVDDVDELESDDQRIVWAGVNRVGEYLLALDIPNVSEDQARAAIAVTHTVERCGRCSTRRRMRSLRRSLTDRINEIPIPLASTRRLKLMYADLASSGRAAVLQNVGMVAATYYNCAFRSQSRYRSFQAASGDDRLGLYVYCERGDADCERLYSLAASAGRVQSIVVSYPRRNRVCEAQQARLESFQL
jgi:hypothetical protein